MQKDKDGGESYHVAKLSLQSYVMNERIACVPSPRLASGVKKCRSSVVPDSTMWIRAFEDKVYVVNRTVNGLPTLRRRHILPEENGYGMSDWLVRMRSPSARLGSFVGQTIIAHLLGGQCSSQYYSVPDEFLSIGEKGETDQHNTPRDRVVRTHQGNKCSRTMIPKRPEIAPSQLTVLLVSETYGRLKTILRNLSVRASRGGGKDMGAGDFGCACNRHWFPAWAA